MLTVIGWLANVFLILCTWRIAYKERWALLAGVTGGVLWSVKAIATQQWDLLFIQIVISSLQLYAWVKWGRNTITHYINIVKKHGVYSEQAYKFVDNNRDNSDLIRKVEIFDNLYRNGPITTRLDLIKN